MPLPHEHTLTCALLHLCPTRARARAQMPCCGLMWFGCYSLATISYNLFMCRQCPEAAVALAQEVLDARADLQRRGFKFDATST